ncbi:MAG: ATP-binding cassette domain-containing protein [Proteobacteria bacterium]|nr:ATP-binding cassette domain-containing protein [Pseudomonadota bacterium]
MHQAASKPAIELTGVTFKWRGGVGFELKVPEFTVGTEEKVLLLGESGSGKSTLLSLICGVATPSIGDVTVHGTDLSRLSRRRRDRFRADNIGVIFQQFNLLPYATPLENILLPLRFSPQRRARIDAPREEALRLARVLGLADQLVAGSLASELSVGQQQRVAVARAMIGQPPLIVADEPTSALDASAQASFLDLLFHQTSEAKSTLVMVSHDERLGVNFDRVIDLGTIVRAQTEGAA